MDTFSDKDLHLLTQLFEMSETQLHTILSILLTEYEYSVVKTNDYIYARGELPFMLVAHMDTVFPRSPIDIFHDREREVIWSPEGLGADDRVGIFIIVKLLRAGYRPHVLFTHGEEKGGLGAQAFATSGLLKNEKINYIIQLDRQGIDDCVFYDCDNPEFSAYVNTFGFKTQLGSFSDISFICPMCGIAGVNLSVGYVDEHSYAEHVYLDVVMNTLEKVECMLNDKECIQYKYIPKKYSTFNLSKNTQSANKCYNCGNFEMADDLLPVQIANGDKALYCIECISKRVNWCKKCGEPFETYGNKEIDICYNCSVGEEK